MTIQLPTSTPKCPQHKKGNGHLDSPTTMGRRINTDLQRQSECSPRATAIQTLLQSSRQKSLQNKRQKRT